MKIEDKLWRSICSNNKQRTIDCFEHIYNRHKSYVVFIAQKFENNPNELQEIVQEVFLTLMYKAKEAKIYRIETLLFEITRFTCLKHIRKKMYHYESTLDITLKRAEHIPDNTIDTTYIYDNILDKTELMKRVKSIMTAQELKIFKLHVFGEYSFNEIAKILKAEESTVKSRYFRAIKRCKDKMKLEDWI